MICLPGDRFCCHIYDSYFKGEDARAAGLPCEPPEGQHSCINPKIPINEELWKLGWSGEEMPADLVDFCDDGFYDSTIEKLRDKLARGEEIDELEWRWVPRDIKKRVLTPGVNTSSA